MINWSAIDPQSAGGRIVRLPARLLPRSKVMRIRRGPARGLKWVIGSATHGCWLGTYELEKQKLLERLVKPGMTVYDVGAQAGFYTMMTSRMTGHTGKVFAFEPSAREACYLIEHIEMNHLNNVQIVQAAVGFTLGLAGFSTNLGQCQNQLTQEKGGLLVPVVTLDSTGLPAPDLIKMDIEGGESDALKGACRMLTQQRPPILIALHGKEHAEFCPAFLRSCGYSVFDLSDKLVTGEATNDEIYGLPNGNYS